MKFEDLKAQCRLKLLEKNKEPTSIPVLVIVTSNGSLLDTVIVLFACLMATACTFAASSVVSIVVPPSG